MRAPWLIVLASLAGLTSCKNDPTQSNSKRTPASCEAGTPRTAPTTVVDGLNEPFDVAVDNTTIYWTEVGTPGRVAAINKDGTGRRQFAPVTANLPFAIGLSTDDVIYQTSHEIVRVPKDGIAPGAVIAAGYDNLRSNGLLVDGADVYFAATRLADDKEVVMRILDDGTSLIEIVAQTERIDALAGDTDFVYYNSGSLTTPTLVRVAKSGGPPETIATGRSCHNVASSGLQVFCAADLAGPFRINVTTKSTIDLCPEWNPLLLVKDVRLIGTGFYLLISDAAGDDRILRVATQGTGQLFATGFEDVVRMTTDGTSLFVTEKFANRIRAIKL